MSDDDDSIIVLSENNDETMDNVFIPDFYSIKMTTTEFKSKDHLNAAMKAQVKTLQAKDTDIVDDTTHSRDALKCQAVLKQLFPKGRVFASVSQLNSLLKLVGESWGFISS